MGHSIKRRLLRRHTRHADRPAWWRPTPAGPVVFDPSIRTAEELVGGDRKAARGSRAQPPSAA